MQLGKLQDALAEFDRLGVRVAAVSADDAEGAQKMVARKELTFPVLSDPAGTMLKQWQRWDEQQDIALAGTFVVRPDGAVVFFEDDGERYSKRPDVRRLLEVAREL